MLYCQSFDMDVTPSIISPHSVGSSNNIVALLSCCHSYHYLILLQAGMQAVRENRYVVLPKDFEKGYKNNIKKDETEHEFYK